MLFRMYTAPEEFFEEKAIVREPASAAVFTRVAQAKVFSDHKISAARRIFRASPVSGSFSRRPLAIRCPS
jgi:hypothetical protein